MLLYTAALAHTRIVTHKQVYTQPSYTQTLLHTNTPPDQPSAQITISLSHSNPLSREKGCTGTPKIAILPQFLTIEPHFVRRSCRRRYL